MKTHHIPTKVRIPEPGESGLEHTLRDTSSTFDRYGLGLVPAGVAARQVTNGPFVEGPWAYAYRLAGVLDNRGGSRAESDRRVADGKETLFEMGDRLVIGGYVFKTEPAPNNNMKLTLVDPLSEEN